MARESSGTPEVESVRSSGGNSIIAVTQRVVCSTLSIGGSRRRTIVAATKVSNSSCPEGQMRNYKATQHYDNPRAAI